MAFTTIQIEHDEGSADMTAKLLGSNPSQALHALVAMGNWLSGVASGALKAKVVPGVASVKASGTFTLDTVIATDVCTVGGIDFTCVASGATGNQFNVGADDDETAENLAAVIAANTILANILTATSDGAVVTITALTPGVHGNAITIASSDATIVASDATLEGGSNGTQYTYYRGGAV